MTLNNYFNIKWKHINSSTFMYGTYLSFKEKGTYFENSLVPSGIVINEWNMMSYYPKDKSSPTLPILEKGEIYQFKFDYDVEPESSIYFKVIYYRKDGTELDYLIVRNKSCEVTYPEEAYSYKIQMINAAAERIIFREITILESNIINDSNLEMNISEVINKQSDLNVRNIIFVEPSFQDLELLKKAANEFYNVILVINWDRNDMSDNIDHLQGVFENFVNEYELHFIGYGPKSNIMAQSMGQIIKSQVFKTYHESKELSKQLESIMGKYQLKLARTPYVYRYESDGFHPQYLENTLNPVRYFKYLDATLINRGYFNEI
nr:accessory Sec system protein Asp3 [Mammaliicoccus sp. Marseille-Q6498]